MLSLSSAAIFVVTLLAAGGLSWVLWVQIKERGEEIKRDREEIRRLQEQQQKVTSDAMERRAEETTQRRKGSASRRLRESRWVRDN